ncbi:MAG: Hpt domain-containing protein [Rubrivivax sp.]|jgi:HPt (histidine-containing phosphotransfer) domain-containing protein|nr:Hpt domain-containing protein [Rubrivivax sp.]MBK8526516.1 Hpt domain-containing protein [Rubrivivax sp.]
MDASVLRKIIGDDEASVREFLALFRQTAQRQRAEMHAACARGEGHQSAAVAHKLKSSARSIGAQALAEFCVEIESAVTAGNLALLREHLVAFDVEWQREKLAIDAYLGDGDGG